MFFRGRRFSSDITAHHTPLSFRPKRPGFFLRMVFVRRVAKGGILLRLLSKLDHDVSPTSFLTRHFIPSPHLR